jgi:uracil-DNA glycosylase family 4
MASAKISSIYVPSEGDPSRKLWLIGEAPGAEETRMLQPFVGASGKLLDSALDQLGISRHDVFITNLCHYQPEKNDFSLLRDSDELKSGLAELLELLAKHRPNAVILFGNQPLEFLTQHKGITKWRGSTLSIDFAEYKIKAIPSYHPAYILRVATEWPVFLCDLSKALEESKDATIKELAYTIHIEPDVGNFLEAIHNASLLGVDIETVKHSTKILCVGFAISETEAYVIPLFDNKLQYVEAVREALLSTVPKVFHNGIFDTSILRLNGYETINYAFDTIIAANLLAPELEKSLAFLTSLYTAQPYYKEEGRSNLPSDTKGWSAKRNKNDLYIYNAKDCCVTYQIHLAQIKELEAEGLVSFYLDYQMQLQQSLVELSLTGMLLDEDRRDLMYTAVKAKRDELQHVLNILAFKLSNGKEKNLNVKSTKALPVFLYETLELPKKFKRGTKDTYTADEDAIVSNMSYCKAKQQEVKKDDTKMYYYGRLKFLELLLKIREYDKQISSYLKVIPHDGRVKSTFKAHGAETGRLSAAKFVDDSGVNLQTIPREKIEV